MRYRIKTGTFAFILHRASGIILALFLLIHVISQKFAVPDKRLLSVLLSIFLIHGLNGVRLIIIDLGWMVDKQKQLFWALMSAGLLMWSYIIL